MTEVTPMVFRGDYFRDSFVDTVFGHTFHDSSETSLKSVEECIVNLNKRDLIAAQQQQQALIQVHKMNEN